LDQRPHRRLGGNRRRTGAAAADNTNVAVIEACLYDPQVNRSYADVAAHYGTAILPARLRGRLDKAKVEQAVLMVERWVSDRCAPPRLHSLAEVNAAIAELITPAQRGAADRAARHHPPLAILGDRPAGTEALAREPLRVRRLADLPGQR
jgi:transposase